jgi:hypothetical protein
MDIAPETLGGVKKNGEGLFPPQDGWFCISGA